MTDLEKLALLFTTERLMKNSGKNTLSILEELFEEGDAFIEKLIEQYPNNKEIILLLNPFTEAKFSRARKKVLDNLGDSLRSLNNTIENK